MASPAAEILPQLPSQASVGSSANPDGHSPRTRLQTLTILLALNAAVFVAALDLTVIATAAPTISHALGSASGYTWLRAGYALASTAAGPTWTNLSDIWGRKPVMLAAVTLFTFSSIICSRASSMAMLIVGRAIQGAGAGGMLLLASVIISDLFDLRRRTLYLGALEICWALSAAVGPVIGGAFSEYASWRWIFYMNIPVGVAILTIFAAVLNVHNPRTPVRAGLAAIDWGGSISLLAITTMILLALDLGGDAFKWSSPQVLCLLFVGLASSAFFFLIEAKFARYPVMPLALFRNASNASALLLSFFVEMAAVAAEYFLPFFFQSVKGAGPLRAGLLALPFIFTESVFSGVSALIINHTGKYMLLTWVGVLLMTLGYGLLTDLKTSTNVALIMTFQILAGAGAGMLIQPPLTALQANVSQRDTASATATASFMRNLADAMSLVIGGTIFGNSMNKQQPKLLAAGVPNDVAFLYTGQNAAANVNSLTTIDNLEQIQVIREAYAWSLRNMWIFYTGIVAVSIFCVILLRPHELSTLHTETRTGLRRDGDVVEVEMASSTPQRGS